MQFTKPYVERFANQHSWLIIFFSLFISHEMLNASTNFYICDIFSWSAIKVAVFIVSSLRSAHLLHSVHVDIYHVAHNNMFAR